MTRVPGISEQIPVKLTPKQGSNFTLQLPKTNRLTIWVINNQTKIQIAFTKINIFCIVVVTLMTGWLI
jgi:hypothetical protein